MTVPNCSGCMEDFRAALEYQENGLVIVPQNLGGKGHFSFVGISDLGIVRVWAGTKFKLGDTI